MFGLRAAAPTRGRAGLISAGLATVLLGASCVIGLLLSST